MHRACTSTRQAGRPTCRAHSRCKPRWLQPAAILASGAAFFAAALLLSGEEPCIKTTAIAAGPVALYYAVALFALPSQFSKFAVAYLREHKVQSPLTSLQEEA